MRTSKDIDYSDDANLTGQQLVFLNALTDGKWAREKSEGWSPSSDKWYERSEIRKKMGLKTFTPSILSERIIKPLELTGIVEQKVGRKKTMKVVRIRKEFGELRLHSLVIRSALPILTRKRPPATNKQNSGKNPITIYNGMYKKSCKVLSNLENIEKEQKAKDDAAYWEQRLQEFDHQDWRELVKIEKLIYNTLKPVGQRCCESGTCSAEECPMLIHRGIAFMIACMVRDWSELSRQMDSLSWGQQAPLPNRDAILQILCDHKKEL